MLLGRNAAWLLLIMKLGPGRTPWNRTFTALDGLLRNWFLAPGRMAVRWPGRW